MTEVHDALFTPPSTPKGGRSPKLPSHVVHTFTWKHYGHHVALAGSFDSPTPHWQPIPMEKKGHEDWEITLPLVPGNKYLYKFVIDGDWRTDWEQPSVWDNGNNNHEVSVESVKFEPSEEPADRDVVEEPLQEDEEEQQPVVELTETTEFKPEPVEDIIVPETEIDAPVDVVEEKLEIVQEKPEEAVEEKDDVVIEDLAPIEHTITPSDELEIYKQEQREVLEDLEETKLDAIAEQPEEEAVVPEIPEIPEVPEVPEIDYLKVPEFEDPIEALYVVPEAVDEVPEETTQELLEELSEFGTDFPEPIQSLSLEQELAGANQVDPLESDEFPNEHELEGPSYFGTTSTASRVEDIELEEEEEEEVKPEPVTFVEEEVKPVTFVEEEVKPVPFVEEEVVDTEPFEEDDTFAEEEFKEPIFIKEEPSFIVEDTIVAAPAPKVERFVTQEAEVESIEETVIKITRTVKKNPNKVAKSRPSSKAVEPNFELSAVFITIIEVIWIGVLASIVAILHELGLYRKK